MADAQPLQIIQTMEAVARATNPKTVTDNDIVKRALKQQGKLTKLEVSKQELKNKSFQYKNMERKGRVVTNFHDEAIDVADECAKRNHKPKAGKLCKLCKPKFDAALRLAQLTELI